jgi:hypothetical protein
MYWDQIENITSSIALNIRSAVINLIFGLTFPNNSGINKLSLKPLAT